MGKVVRVQDIAFECRMIGMVIDDIDNAWLTENRWMTADWGKWRDT